MRACFRYVTSYGFDAFARSQFLPWMTVDYFELLLDSQFLPIKKARSMAEVMRIEDPKFFTYFYKLPIGDEPKELSTTLRRALSLLDGLSDCKALSLWLYKLTLHPDEMIRAPAVKAICRVNYFDLLLNRELLSIEEARKMAEFMRREDPAFFLQFSRLSAGTDSKEVRARLRSALSLLDGLDDYNTLFPWLRKLTTYPDEKIRSQAVKAFCRVRSNPTLIKRQLQSPDARVRANVIEALWRLQTREAKLIFQSALKDPHYRVVVNALIGLLYQEDQEAFQTLLKYCGHPSEACRAAVVWALGRVADVRAIPVLEARIADETSEPVREKARIVLADLQAKQVRVESKEASEEKASRRAEAAGDLLKSVKSDSDSIEEPNFQSYYPQAL